MPPTTIRSAINAGAPPPSSRPPDSRNDPPICASCRCTGPSATKPSLSHRRHPALRRVRPQRVGDHARVVGALDAGTGEHEVTLSNRAPDSSTRPVAVNARSGTAFSYDQLSDTREIDVRTRLRWLEQVMPDYAPGPYEQLAAAYPRAGDEEHAQQVVIARHRRRYSEADPVERVWGALQRWTVGFGYRPWLAVFWLVLFAVLGGAWFAAHPPPAVDQGQNPAFNPWLFAADTLLPIVNLGQDGYWRLEGASQWIGSGLVAAGWILATTAAAGAARVLKRA